MGLETAALVSIGSAALGSGMSFAQASKQRKLQSQAEQAAQKAFDEAKSKLDVNYLEGLTIAKEPFELEREALAQAGAAALQAGIEGDQRGAGAVAGRVLMAQQQQQAQQRAAMAREQQRIDEMRAQEESRLQGARVDLDLGEAVGQQQRALQAQEMGASAMNQAIGGMFDIAAAGFEGADLFSGREGLQQAKQFTRQQNPTRRTRRLGNANIQSVGLPEYDPNYMAGVGLTGQPGLFAPLFKQG
tara:strand:+ start:5114 stop:5848 length:735 start_codon:yes stop_codon:yes gene_type:complete